MRDILWWPKRVSFYDRTAEICAKHYNAMSATNQMKGSRLIVLRRRASIAEETVNALTNQKRRAPLDAEVTFRYYVTHKTAIRNTRERLVRDFEMHQSPRKDMALLDRQQKRASSAAIAVTGLSTCGDEDHRLEELAAR